MDRRLTASAYLAIRLGEVSRRGEGVAAAQEAAMLYRELAVKSRCFRTAC